MPKTLTRPQFLQLQRGKGIQNPDYSKYLRFLLARRGQANRPTDPFAPLGEAAIQKQAAQGVRSQVDPLIKEILAGIDSQARGLEGLTDRYASRIGGYAPEAANIYGRAVGESAGVADAVASRVSGAGDASAASLKAALGQASMPEGLIADLAGGAAQTGRGASNAGFVSDSADVQALISRGAGAADLARAMPEFARMEGLQAIGDLRRKGQEQVGEIRSKVPGLIADLAEKGRDRDLDRAIARAGFQTDQDRIQLGYDELGSRETADLQGQIQAERNRKQTAKRAAVKSREDSVVSATGAARGLARSLYKGETVKTPGDPRKGIQASTTVKRPDWFTAFRQVLNEIEPGLSRYGVKRSRIGEIARQALLDAGFKMPSHGYPRG